MPPKKATPAAVDDSLKKVELTITDAKTLILALRATETDVCAKACEALEHFADASDRNKMELIQGGVLEPLVKLLASPTVALRQHASLCLCTLASTLEARLAMRKSGVPYLEPLLQLLAADQSAVCHENACLVLDRLCNEYASRVDIFKANALQNIVDLLSAPAPEVKRAAVRVLAKLLEEYDVRAAVINLDAFSPLVYLLDADYSEVQQSALTCLARCARNQENISLLVEMGLMERLIAFVMVKENRSSHVFALTALSGLLQEPGAVARLGTITPVGKDREPVPAPLALLVGLVAGTEEAVQISAMSCIARAAAAPANRAVLLEFKAEAALVPRLLSEDAKAPFSPQLVSAAARALAALAKSRPNAEVIGNLFGIHKLARLLSHEHEDVVVAALSALSVLVENVPSNRKILVETESVPKLLQLLLDSRAEAKAFVASCVSSLAQTEFSRASVKPAAVEGLVAALGSEDVPLLQEALRALAVLARDADVREKLLQDASALKLASGLLGHADANVVRAAALLVCACGDDAVCSQRLCELGTLIALHKLRNTAAPFGNVYVEAAYNRLFNTNLSAKYALTGVLDVHDHISDGFFDAGPLSVPPPPLQQLCSVPVDSSKPVLLINSFVPKAEPAPALLEPAHHEAKPKLSKAKTMAERAAQNASAAAADAKAAPAQAWSAPSDTALASLFAQVRSDLLNIEESATRAARLAMLVSERMGGPVPLDRVTDFDLEMAALKKSQRSNVLPIGLIKHGSYRSRALLFKALADQVDLPCSLRRAAYGRVFNIVHLPDPHVVDVLHAPGRLLPVSASPQLELFWEKHPAP